MKKLCTTLTVLVLIALSVILLPVQTQAAEIPDSGNCGEKVTFTYADGLLTISGTGPMTDFDYEVRPPWDNDHCPVTKIVIEEGVTSIGNRSFEGCYQLEEVTIANTVTRIGKGAFANCNAETIVIPDSVERIEASAFNYSDKLTNLTLGSGLQFIGNSAFYNCTKLQMVAIPASVTMIENAAFSTCTSLKGIFVNNSNAQYASDAHGALLSNDMTTLLQMPGGFSGTYTLPGTVKSIAQSAFSTCRGLTEVYLPDGLLNIGSGAFTLCTKLTSISIPESVTSIGPAAFSYCEKLIYNEFGNAKYLGNSDNPYVALIQVTDKTATEYPIPEGTKFISDRAFENCTAVTRITLPDTVAQLGEWAFARCPALTEVILSNSMIEIRTYTFLECPALTTVTLGSSLRIIGEQAFFGCTALQNIQLPRALTTIGRMAFSGCSSLTSLTLPKGISTVDLDAFAYCQNLTSVTFCGTEAQWKNHELGFYSTPLANIQVTYHNFTEATCTTAQTCTLCEETVGDPLGHTPGDEPTETTGQICTVCGEELAPALNTETTSPDTQSTITPSAPATSVEDSDPQDSTAVVIWIIVGTLIAAGSGAGGFFLYKKYKPQILQKFQKPQE